MLRKRKPPEPPRQVPLRRIPAQILDLFEECCRKEEKAVLLWPDYMALSKAVFGRVEGETFSFKNPSPLRESLMDPTVTVSVTFSHLSRVYAFVTWFVRLVHEETPEGKVAHLFMKIPVRIAVADSRSSCRVPVCPDALLETKVFPAKGKAYKAQAVDICLSGILLQFEGDVPALEDKEKVTLEISLSEKRVIPLPKQEREEEEGKEGEGGEEKGRKEEGKEDGSAPVEAGKEGEEKKEPERVRIEIRPVEKPFRIEAVLMRKEGGRKAAFYFPSCLTPEGLNPPENLKRVVKLLEMAYLRKRAECGCEDA